MLMSSKYVSRLSVDVLFHVQALILVCKDLLQLMVPWAQCVIVFRKYYQEVGAPEAAKISQVCNDCSKLMA